jgi:hypothetical protein
MGKLFEQKLPRPLDKLPYEALVLRCKYRFKNTRDVNRRLNKSNPANGRRLGMMIEDKSAG